jgi:hypothetical protein
MSSLCSQKTALLLNYTAAAKNHCEAINTLHDRLIGSPKGAYDELYQTAERQRRALEQARLELDQHARDHGC